MRILGSAWSDGYLDGARLPGECRIRVAAWRPCARVDGLYFVRRPDLAAVVTYWREIGWRELARKAASRRREAHRNDKWLSVGVGQVLESDPDSAYAAGGWVAFVAPAHPRCVERVALPEALMAPLASPPRAAGQTGSIELGDAGALDPEAAMACSRLAGWSGFSGEPVPRASVRALLGLAVAASMPTAVAPPVRRLETSPEAPVAERVAGPRQSTARLRAVLFGYGNYAKTTILPNLDPRIEVVKIHEIDPVQLGPVAGHRMALDSSPWPREDERFDVYLVAGFHHTHASIALAALERGAATIVEKPLATELAQVDALERALRGGAGRLLAGFQRRFWPFNETARRDLELASGEPISYRCAVHEERLPPRHWYRWPRSRGRIVANGCHWIDHFLFLNGYAEVSDLGVSASGDDDVVVHLALDNGARFEMWLTDRATARTGMRNTIELIAGNGRVVVENDAEYAAERRGRVIRRLRRPRLASYRAMYAALSRRIAEGRAGDDAVSVTRSARVTLWLADELSRSQALAAGA